MDFMAKKRNYLLSLSRLMMKHITESKFYSFYNDNDKPNHLYSLNGAPFSTLKKTQNFDKMFRKFVTTYNIFPGRKSPVRQKRDFEK